MAASNIRFLYNNLADTASLTESSEVETLPIENIQDSRLGCRWRSTGTDENIVLDLGSAQSIDSFAILGHNISSSVTVLKIQGHTSDSWGSPDVDIDLLDPQGGGGSYNVYDSKFILWYLSSASKRYWRIVITDDSNPDAYLEIGRVFLGAYFEPSTGARQGLTINKRDLSEVIKNMQGTPYSNLKDKIWIYDFSLESLLSDPAGTDDLQTIIDMFDNAGSNKDIIVSIDPDRGSGTNRYSNLKRFSAYGLLTNDFNTTDVAQIKFNSSFIFEESV